MNGLAVVALVAVGLPAVLFLLIHLRDRGRNAPSRESRDGKGTWGGGEKSPHGGVTDSRSQLGHGGDVGASGG